MYSQAHNYHYFPGIAIEKRPVTKLARQDIIGSSVWTRTPTEILNREDMNSSFHFGYPCQERTFSSEYYHTGNHETNLRITFLNGSIAQEKVSYDYSQPKYRELGHGNPSSFGVSDPEFSDSAEWRNKNVSIGTLFEENDDENIRPPADLGYPLRSKGSLMEKITEWNKTKLPIIRRPVNIMVFGPSVINDSQFQNQNLLDIDLRIVGDSFEDVLTHPWSHHETLEGRRIIKIEREQSGCTLKAHFLIKHGQMHSSRGKDGNSKHLEVSCIKFDHEDGITAKYFITSVDVIEIVEFLIDNTTLNSALRWKERGRIRSNLAPLLFKTASELGPMHLPFENQIQKYKSRKTHRILKTSRLLLWVDLGYALWKALRFYCVFMPVEYSTSGVTDAYDSSYQR